MHAPTHKPTQSMNIYRIALFLLGNWITAAGSSFAWEKCVVGQRLCALQNMSHCVCVCVLCSTPVREQLSQPATHSAARKTRLGNEFQITCLAKMCACSARLCCWCICGWDALNLPACSDYNCVSLCAQHLRELYFFVLRNSLIVSQKASLSKT
jgi:DMSO reductase anchor subunit